MNKILLILFSVLVLSALSSPLTAKCYRGRGWVVEGKDFWVCVKGDGSSAKQEARDACKAIMGSRCEVVSHYGSMCSSGYCYTSDGKKHHTLQGY